MNKDRKKNELRADMVVTRVFDARVMELWRYWTEPDLFAHWWGPTYFGVAKAEMNVRPGGRFLWCMSSPDFYDGPNPCNVGTFLEVEPYRRMRYRTRWADAKGREMSAAEAGMDMPDEMTEEVTFEGLPDGRTVVTYTEYDLPVNLMFAYTYVGMSQSLDKLAAALKSERG